ncbi:MAG: phosphoenolpyruvate--protein phosphotransferase [Blautia sp.]|nr:phosphoenolpyruvate--protein phosphotransferase [Blautia sp.]
MEIVKGRTAFPGIAIGKTVFYSRGEYLVRQYMVNNEKKELGDYERVREEVREQLKQLLEREEDEENGTRESLREQLSLLEGKSFSNAVRSLVEKEKVNLSYALTTTRDELTLTFHTLEEDTARRRLRAVREVTRRMLSILGHTSSRIRLGEEPVILLADALSPGEIVKMEKEKLLAVVTLQGSEISHTAIMAKNLNIPSVVDVAVREEWDGVQAIVDGYTGTLYLNPSLELLREYENRMEEDKKEREELLKYRNREDVTLDGKRIPLLANVGSLNDLESVRFYGADGIGLLRSEFQYLGKDSYPREEELFQEYRKLAESMGEKPAVIRTVDLGADKRSPYMDIPMEENPIMGNRGIRLCLDRRNMFRTQLMAIYRASVYGNLEIMYPMIVDTKEIEEIDAIIEEVKQSLSEKEIPFREIRRGIMVETPAAVMIAGELAEKVDFLSLGTNDLTQYTLAMDRQNPLLKNKYNDHHPAVFRMIRMVIEEGHAAGCNVYICGEIAADTAYTETFLRMGVDALSVVPACILPVRKILRNTDLSADQRTE